MRERTTVTWKEQETGKGTKDGTGVSEDARSGAIRTALGGTQLRWSSGGHRPGQKMSFPGFNGCCSLGNCLVSG